MSMDKYQTDCPGCAPVVLDPETGARNEAATRHALEFWKTVCEADKLAFHAFCCNNSRDQGDVARVEALSKRMGEAIGKGMEAEGK